MKEMFQQMCTGLDAGEDFVLVTIVRQSGSTPRMAGSRMIVKRNGQILGTIGGGIVEMIAAEEAQISFADRCSRCRAFDLSNSDAANIDMICGGKMELFFEYIAATETNRAVFHSILASIYAGRPFILVCPFKDEHGDLCRFVINHAGEAFPINQPESLLTAINQDRSRTSMVSIIEHQGKSYLLSRFVVLGTVYLLGAGHVAVCTAEAAARVGFRVVVIDDRLEFANRECFPSADVIKVRPTFSDCFQDEEIDTNAYLVIVTRGHMHDMEVLDQALRTNAGYIGMIGSRKKRDVIFSKLMEGGVPKTQLHRVHCPIGIAIEADTPEEIAVSIVAELIHERAIGRRA